MANHTQIYRENKELSKEEVLKVISEINSELFNDLLDIKVEKNYIGIQSTDKGDGITMWFESDGYDLYTEDDVIKVCNNYLDIRQGHSLKFYWWLDYVLTCELANRLNSKCVGEGFPYPTELDDNYQYKYTNTNFTKSLDNSYLHYQSNFLKRKLGNKMRK